MPKGVYKHIPHSGTFKKGRKGQVSSTSFKKGQTPWNKGTKGLQKKENNYFYGKRFIGENNLRWKGDEVGYLALHDWVIRKLGQPDTCEHCKKSGLKARQIHWANTDHKYKRNLTDWLRLCAKCHKAYDKKNN